MVPFPNKTFLHNNEKAIEAGRKGGKVVTDKQRLAQKIASWKRYGINKKCATKVMKLYADREFTTADWFKHIDDLEEIAKHEPKMIPMLVNMKKEWAKFVHGDKITTENVHIHINWEDRFKNAEIRFEETD